MSVSSNIVTVDHLRALRACPEQVDLFESLYPDGAVLTRAVLLAAASAGLDVGCYARRVLPPVAREVYERATDSACAELLRAEAEAETEFDRAMLEIEHAAVENQAQIEACGAEYRRAKAAALETYRRAEATALADALGLVEMPEVQS